MRTRIKLPGTTSVKPNPVTNIRNSVTHTPRTTNTASLLSTHLGGVLSGERSSTVRTPAAIGVDDNLAAGKAGVAVGAADHEAAGGVEVVDRVVVEVLGGHDVLDHVLHEVGADLLVAHVVVVLARDHHGVDSLRDHAPVLLFVRHGHLSGSHVR